MLLCRRVQSISAGAQCLGGYQRERERTNARRALGGVACADLFVKSAFSSSWLWEEKSPVHCKRAASALRGCKSGSSWQVFFRGKRSHGKWRGGARMALVGLDRLSPSCDCELWEKLERARLRLPFGRGEEAAEGNSRETRERGKPRLGPGRSVPEASARLHVQGLSCRSVQGGFAACA